jgi:CarboxypepD_reg-like domain/TonB-dependent Receptor Plug Domain
MHTIRQRNSAFRLFLSLFLLTFATLTFAQKGDIRGVVLDKSNGQPVPFATVQLSTSPISGALTDVSGFFNISDIAYGKYTLSTSVIGYDSVSVQVNLNSNVTNQSLYLQPANVQIGAVEITSKRETKRNDVQVSVERVTPTQIKSLPSTGGEPDLAQYLQVLPGVVFTGDQGGQLYVRGGSPVQNKILIDGMTIYNPFHSIGFFSVFETEVLRNVNVYTGGFGAEFGGRTSAVIDVQTREGNKKRLSGLVSASPFQVKAIVEGPLVPLTEGGTSVSYLLTAKHSYLPTTSKAIYHNLNPKKIGENGLPFDYTDTYGKISLNTKSGTSINLFGFSFNDRVRYDKIANLDWESGGGGMNFKIIPENTKIIFGGRIAASGYKIGIIEADNRPRSSTINGFEAAVNITDYDKQSESNYGFEIIGNTTKYEGRNVFNLPIELEENNTEAAVYYKYKIRFANDKLVLEPSMRGHYYQSVGEFSPEPRLGAKWNATNKLRFKFAGGYFTQNLISTVSERDIVNLFVGFLTSPGSLLNTQDPTKRATSYLQKAWHAIGGLEYDITPDLSVNVEPYAKWYPQLISLNRNKKENQDPDYMTETGEAQGIDFSFKYTKRSYNITANYSYAQVTRNDGQQTYFTNFDRRHNINIYGAYRFGRGKLWEAGARWNYGSGFPFTQTAGFYNDLNFSDGLATNVLTANLDPQNVAGLGIAYSSTRNGGRLPDYHRLDISLKKTINFSRYSSMDITASATNMYDRNNMFYFDRVNYTRVNQLPLIPSLTLTARF